MTRECDSSGATKCAHCPLHFFAKWSFAEQGSSVPSYCYKHAAKLVRAMVEWSPYWGCDALLGHDRRHQRWDQRKSGAPSCSCIYICQRDIEQSFRRSEIGQKDHTGIANSIRWMYCPLSHSLYRKEEVVRQPARATASCDWERHQIFRTGLFHHPYLEFYFLSFYFPV